MPNSEQPNLRCSVGLTIGRLGDRIGRRKALLVSLGLYSVFSLVGAFSTDIWMLVLCRFLAGVGIGAELPLVDAYIADLAPPSVRGRATAWAFTIGFCGVPIAGFLARGLVGHTLLGFEGWRWLFLVGAIGSLVVWILRAGLPESPRWLCERGSRAEAFHTYQAEHFPTSLRATAAGSAYSISRLATAAMPYVLLPVLDTYGAAAMFLVVAVAMTLLIIDIAALGPDTTGLPILEG